MSTNDDPSEKDARPSDKIDKKSDAARHPEKTPEASGKKKSRFAHLHRAAKVVSAKRHRGLIGAVVAAVVLVVIFIVMLSGGHAQQAAHPATSQWAGNNDGILSANAKHLAQLRNAQATSQTPSFPMESSQPDTKALMARRNAPTTMYAAALPSTDLSGEDAKNKQNILAGQGAFSRFANTQSTRVNTVTATKIQHPRFTIAAGEFIHAALETAINSDLPGMVRAVITQPVYAYVGEKPVIPAGSRLIGQYAALTSNSAATTRVFVIWNRVVTPSGISILINSPGSDALGRSGVGADAVDTHFWKIFGTASLLSIMGASTASSGVGTADQPNSANMYRQSIASAFQQSAQSSLSQNLNIKPTLHIHQGDAMTVFVAQDVDLYAVLGGAS